MNAIKTFNQNLRNSFNDWLYDNLSFGQIVVVKLWLAGAIITVSYAIIAIVLH